MTDTPEPIDAAGDPTRLFETSRDPMPLVPASADPRPRKRPAPKPSRLDWRPALGIALREPGGGDDTWQPVTAVAFHGGWVTARIEGKHGDQVMAFPAWRVIEIELKERA